MNIKGKRLRIVTCTLLSLAMVALLLQFVPVKASAEGSAKAYTNLVEIKNNSGFTPGTKYIAITNTSDAYNMTFASTDCLLGMPNGAGLVLANSLGSTGRNATSDLTLAISVDIPLIKGAGFDGCSGSFYNASSPYVFYCSGGGVSNLSTRLYSYSENTYSSSDIAVTLKSGVEVPTGAKSLTKNDIVVKVRLNSIDYVVTGYTFTDSSINYRQNDNQISIDFGGVVKALDVSTTGLAKKVWEEDNTALINATTVDDDDIEALEDAIGKGEAEMDDTGELTEEDLAPLRDKLAAAKFLKDHAATLNIDSNDAEADDYEDLKDTLDDLNDLPDEVKQYISEDIADETNGSLAESVKVAEERKFITDFITSTEGDIFPTATVNNYEQILSGEETWNDLSQDKKDAINADLLAAGSKNYEDLLELAEIEHQKVLEEEKFIADYITDEKGNVFPISTVDNYAQIISGESTWKNLSHEEKAAIDEKLVTAGSMPYEELLKLAKTEQAKVLEEEQFIEVYISDEDGDIITAVTEDNFAKILAGKSTWDNLPQEEKDAINAKLLAAGSKTYEELLELAQKEYQKDLLENAKTGDTNDMLPWIILLTMSGLAAGGTVFLKRRKSTIE